MRRLPKPDEFIKLKMKSNGIIFSMKLFDKKNNKYNISPTYIHKIFNVQKSFLVVLQFFIQKISVLVLPLKLGQMVNYLSVDNYPILLTGVPGYQTIFFFIIIKKLCIHKKDLPQMDYYLVNI